MGVWGPGDRQQCALALLCSGRRRGCCRLSCCTTRLSSCSSTVLCCRTVLPTAGPRGTPGTGWVGTKAVVPCPCAVNRAGVHQGGMRVSTERKCSSLEALRWPPWPDKRWTDDVKPMFNNSHSSCRLPRQSPATVSSPGPPPLTCTVPKHLAVLTRAPAPRNVETQSEGSRSHVTHGLGPAPPARAPAMRGRLHRFHRTFALLPCFPDHLARPCSQHAP